MVVSQQLKSFAFLQNLGKYKHTLYKHKQAVVGTILILWNIE